MATTDTDKRLLHKKLFVEDVVIFEVFNLPGWLAVFWLLISMQPTHQTAGN